jgi:hypothetical protein
MKIHIADKTRLLSARAAAAFSLSLKKNRFLQGALSKQKYLLGKYLPAISVNGTRAVGY